MITPNTSFFARLSGWLVVWSFIMSLGSPLTADEIPELVGRWPYGASLAVTIEGDRAFFGNGSVLQIADISNPASPTVIGEIELPSFIKDIDVVGNTAIVAAMGGGLQLIDVTPTAVPEILGSSRLPSEAISLAVNGALTFVADRRNGLKILGVSDPSHPSAVGELTIPSDCYGIATSGNHVFLTCTSAGLVAIDVTTPSEPSHVGTLDLFFDGGIEVDGYTGYASTGTGLHEIALNQPTAPQHVNSYYTGGSPVNATISGGLGYVAAGHAGLAVVSLQPWISNPIAVLDSPNVIADVAHVGSHVLAADGQGGLKSIDVSDPTSPVEVVSTGAAGFARRVATVADLVLVADRDLRVLQRTSPDALIEIGSLRTPGESRDIAVSGDLVFVADGSDGLLVVDISDPSAPIPAGSVDTTGYALGVAVREDHVFIAAREGGMQVVDVSSPSAPAVVPSATVPGYVEDVVVAGDHAFVTDPSSGLKIYDVSTPASPVLVGHGPTSVSSLALAVTETRAYLVGYLSDLWIYDIHDLSNPSVLGSWTGYGLFRDVAVRHDMVYVADDYCGLHVIDVGTPETPHWITTLDLQRPLGVVVDGDTLFSADSAAGVSIYRTGYLIFDDGFESGDTSSWVSASETQSP
jgi:hypothetical protein